MSSAVGLRLTDGRRDSSLSPATAHLLCLGACSALGVAAAASWEACAHWFVIPVVLCGSVTALLALEWLRGRADLLDPAGLSGVYGLYFFLVAPLLHVGRDWWMPFVVPPDDWRPWLGAMALLNLIGLLLYVAVLERMSSRPSAPSRNVWRLVPGRFFALVLFFAALSVVLQAWVYANFGGFAGYLAAFADTTSDQFRSFGLVFMFSEAFPLLAILAYAVYKARRGKSASWIEIAAVLVAFLAAKVLFGGLRGSRANYVWPLFWAVGILHLWVRPISRRVVLAGVVGLVPFMYAYGFYKSYGTDAMQALEDSQARDDMAQDAKRGWDGTLLGDLGRSDVQAWLLHRFWGPGASEPFEFGLGRTYLGAVTLLIPASLWPDRPATKVQEGTAALFGNSWRFDAASNAYGISGEAMLNFGPAAVPVAFMVMAWLVGRMRRWIKGLDGSDARTLLVPFVVSFIFYFLVWDSDIIFYYFITSGLLPLAIVFVASQRIPRPATSGVPSCLLP